jgi:hypothetical protein
MTQAFCGAFKPVRVISIALARCSNTVISKKRAKLPTK